jgi:hypothetical protein
MTPDAGIDNLRPVCAGAALYEHGEVAFSPIAFHPHPEATCPGAASGLNWRAGRDCPIRTYASWRDVDPRFDGQLVTTGEELALAAMARQGAIRGWVRVVMPIALAQRLYGYVTADFDLDTGELEVSA